MGAAAAMIVKVFHARLGRVCGFFLPNRVDKSMAIEGHILNNPLQFFTGWVMPVGRDQTAVQDTLAIH